MGRTLVSIGFVVIFALSLYFFQTLRDKSLKEKLAEAEDEPRLSFEAMQVFQYKQKDVVGFFSAGQAQFFEPNRIELYNSVQGYRVKEGKREMMRSQSGEITLLEKGIAKVMTNASVEKAQLENAVRVEAGGLKIDSPFVEYTKKTERLKSHMPVNVKGPRYSLHGDKGFEYELLTQKMQVFGPIAGTLDQLDGVTP